MEAYNNHLEKLKVPEIPSVDPVVELDPNVQILMNPPIHNPALLEDRIRVSHPNSGEVIHERVQTIRADHLNQPHSSDLSKNEKLSSESSPSDYESDNDSDEVGEKKHKPGRVKKVKTKLANVFRKLTGKEKKEPHEEQHEHHHQHHEHHEHHHHRDGARRGSHQSVEKVVSSMPLDYEKSLLEDPASSHDTLVQHNLQAAFEREGLQATESQSASHQSRNRYESEIVTVGNTTLDIGRAQDILDHRTETPSRVRDSNALFSEKSTWTPGSASSPAHPSVPLHSISGEFTQTYRDPPLSQSPGYSSPHVHSSPLIYPAADVHHSLSSDLHAPTKHNSMSIQPETPTNLVRSPELWDVAAEVRHEANEEPLTLAEAERNAEEFSERFARIGEHRNSLTDEDKFFSSAGKATLADAEKNAEEFSGHFQKIGQHRNSLTPEDINNPVVDRAPHVPIVTPEHPFVHLTSFEDRLSAAKATWLLPSQPEPPRLDRSETDLLDLSKHSPSSQSFERTESDLGISGGRSSVVSEHSNASFRRDFPSTDYRSEAVHHQQSSPWTKQSSGGLEGTQTFVSTSSLGSSSDELAIPDVLSRPERPSPHPSQSILTSPPMQDDSAIFERDVVPDMIPPVHPMHEEVHFVDIDASLLPSHSSPSAESRRSFQYQESPVVVQPDSDRGEGKRESIRKADHFLDAEFEGNDLEQHHTKQKVDVASTIPVNYSQPIVENYEAAVKGEAKVEVSSEKPVTGSEIDASQNKDHEEPKGIIATVVGSVTGMLSAVTGVFTHQPDISKSDDESEYLPFELKEKTDIGFPDESEIKHKDFDPHSNIVDIVISGVMELVHGKPDEAPMEESVKKTEETTEVKTNLQRVQLSGEFVAPPSDGE